MIIGDAFVPLALINCWGEKEEETVENISAKNLSSSFVPGKIIVCTGIK